MQRIYYGSATNLQELPEGQLSIDCENIFQFFISCAFLNRYSLHVPADKQYGSLENGRWTGIIGDVVNKVRYYVS